jgi:hypothetical protein
MILLIPPTRGTGCDLLTSTGLMASAIGVDVNGEQGFVTLPTTRRRPDSLSWCGCSVFAAGFVSQVSCSCTSALLEGVVRQPTRKGTNFRW